MQPFDGSLAFHISTKDHLAYWALVIAWLSYSGAVFAPLAAINGLFSTKTVSLVSVAIELAKDKEIILFFIIVLFSFVIPTVKLSYLHYLYLHTDIHSSKFGYRLSLYEKMSKWAMVDVFVVAVAIVALKASVFSSMLVRPGLYMLVVFVLSSSFAAARIKRATSRIRNVRSSAEA